MEPYLEDPIPKKPSAALDLVGITVFIVGFFLAVGIFVLRAGLFQPTSNVFISYVGLLYLLAVFQSSGITCLKKIFEALEVDNEKEVEIVADFLLFLAIDLEILILATIL